MARRIHAIVTGRVQGVGYRVATVAEARRLGLAGWVANRPDGAVELEAEGESTGDHDVVAALVAWCERGPPAARVAGVAVTEIATTGATGFTIRDR